MAAEVGSKDEVVRGRLKYLDLLRFFAALAILLFHYTFRGPMAGSVPQTYPSMASIFRYGFFAVPLFFMISAFSVLRSSKERTWREYLIVRVSRLYPAYWICVTLTFIVLVAARRYSLDGLSLQRYVVNLSMLQEFLRVDSIDGVYWTLAVQLRFYLIIGVVLALRQARNLEILALAWLVISGILLSIDVPILSGLIVPQYAWAFVAGIVFYYVRERGWSLIRVGAILSSLGIGLLTAIERASDVSLMYGQRFSPAILCALVAAYFAVLALEVTRRRSPGHYAIAAGLGALTLPLFLLHQQIGYVLLRLFNGLCHPVLSLCCVTALLIGISYLSATYVIPPLSYKMRGLLMRSRMLRD